MADDQRPAHRRRRAVRRHHHAAHPMDSGPDQQAAHQGGSTRRDDAVGDRQARAGRRVGHLLGGDLRALCGGGRRRRQSAWPAARFTGGPRSGAWRRAGLRCATHRAGSAQRVFIITEKQYGFGDLVALTVTGGGDAQGTVEDVTLRVTKLRTSDGELFTVPNGQIVKSLNLSKDWARAVVDVPVPTSADLNQVNDVLDGVAKAAMQDDGLPQLLLDEPSLMGVESIEVDTVNLRMVARTLPGKQFEVGRRLRALVASELRR